MVYTGLYTVTTNTKMSFAHLYFHSYFTTYPDPNDCVEGPA